MRLLPDFYEANLSDEEIITYMREDGITYQEISKYTKMNRDSIKSFTDTLQTKNLPIAMVSKRVLPEGYVGCSICLKTVLRDEMPKRKVNGLNIYHLLLCHECLMLGEYENKNSLELYSLARRLARKEKATRLENEVSLAQIPYGYFAFLFTKQKGLCFYTDIPLSFNKRENLPNNISTDRIIYNKPYQQGNIVFAINKANVVKNDMTLDEMKNWTPKWHSRLMDYYKNLEDYLMENVK